MPRQIITPEDVAGSTHGLDPATVATLVAGANAKAIRVAPTLATTTDSAQLAEAKLILVGAVKRWCEAGSGAYSQQTIGPASVAVDTRQRNVGFSLWPSEVRDLQALGDEGDDDQTRAWTLPIFDRDQAPSVHPFLVA